MKKTATVLAALALSGVLAISGCAKDTTGTGGATTPAASSAAAKYLSDAGVSTPVTINLQYNPDHYGSSSDQEYGLIKQQLEATGLFTVNLQSTEWVTYSQERTKDAYPVFQMGWFPDFPDADNYLTPFFAANNFLKVHFEETDAGKAIGPMIQAEVTETDAAKRQAAIEDIQKSLAEALPTLPLLQGSQWAVTRANMTGVHLMISDELAFTTLTSPDKTDIIIGTTDKTVTIDPAGSYDHGSLMLETQVYQFLVNFKPGDTAPTPDAADKCDFSAPTVYTCTLKPGLKFANGDDLTSSDVKFSFDRIIKINDDNGPSSLLGNLDSIDTPDPLTVNFNLKEANDQTFAQVLATSAGPIVDEQVMSPDALTPDNDIVAKQGFSGPYTFKTYNFNDTAVLVPYAGYNGGLDKPAQTSITYKTFTDASNLRLSISNGDIDVAYRSLTPTDITTLQADSNVKVWQDKGGEIRYIVFNMNTMPDGTSNYTDAQKLAIRQAIASSVDRDAISQNVYKGQYTPLCSYVPDGFVGATKAVCDMYPLDK
ncbi:MAG: ABC transporter substrate-binding protein [Propionibacteriaceae bacterium]|nr:ABC transporter substrate-binding protein [Propionibacteriaceae bacterium]